MGVSRNPKGMGNFIQNANGTVTYRKSVGYQENGKRKVLCVTAENKTVALKKMREKEKEWEAYKRDSTLESKDTVASLCSKHLAYQVEMGDLKPKSVDRREVTISKHIEPYPLGSMQIKAVKIRDVEEHIKLLSDKNLSGSSIIKVVDVLNAAYKWACLRGEMTTNPVELVKPTLVKRIQKLNEKTVDDVEVEILTEEEQKIFLKEALRKNQDGNYANAGALYIVFLLFTGMRVGELLALKWSDVDMDSREISISKSRSMARNRKDEGAKYVMVEGTTKNSKARRIEISEAALAILKEIERMSQDVSAEQYICLTRTGRPNTTSNLENRNHVIMKKAGLPHKGGLHILRRTFATNCYRDGGRMKDVAAYIGDLTSTAEKYYVAARNRVNADGNTEVVVNLPVSEKKSTEVRKVESKYQRGMVICRW